MLYPPELRGHKQYQLQDYFFPPLSNCVHLLTPESCDEHKQQEGTPMLLDQATSKNVSRAIEEINAFE